MKKLKRIYYYHFILKNKILFDLVESINEYEYAVDQIKTIWRTFYKIERSVLKKIPFFSCTAIDSVKSTSVILCVNQDFETFLIETNGIKFSVNLVNDIINQIFHDNNYDSLDTLNLYNRENIRQTYERNDYDAFSQTLESIFDNRVKYTTSYRDEIINCKKWEISLSFLVNMIKPFKK